MTFHATHLHSSANIYSIRYSVSLTLGSSIGSTIILQEVTKVVSMSEKIVEKVPGDVYKKSCAEFGTELTLIKHLDQTAGFTQPVHAFLSNYLVGGGVAKS